ncbi:hypothetical protein GGR57DRAFT_184414 [Xylariaceae sp. FL1272]|nr:hypothetical protein GGR57DRAFT_184414 [Xylariaceae sp. FL1272]
MARQAWDLVSTPFQGPAKPQCLLCEPISESYLSSPAGRLGPSTLAEQCIRVAANNLNDLDAQCLDGLPAHLLGEIWQFVANHKKALSFKAWKLFASIMSRDRDTAKCMSYSLTRWFSSIPGDLTAPLSEYLSPLASDTFEFLTHLTIAGRVNVETHDLLQLGQLRNLAVLEFIEPLLNHDVPTEFPRVSDSIVREWARQTDPFPLLRILRVWGCHFTTTRSLQYLDAFPSLVVYDVAGKKNDWRDRDNYSAYWICRTNKVSRQIIKHLAKYAKQLYTNLDEVSIFCRKGGKRLTCSCTLGKLGGNIPASRAGHH